MSIADLDDHSDHSVLGDDADVVYSGEFKTIPAKLVDAAVEIPLMEETPLLGSSSSVAKSPFATVPIPRLVGSRIPSLLTFSFLALYPLPPRHQRWSLH